MDFVDGVIGQEGRPGMRQVKVWGGREARGPYRKVEVEVKVEGGVRTRQGYAGPERSFWIECRECGTRRRVPTTNRSELIRALDAGEVRCTECGNRMVEG